MIRILNNPNKKEFVAVCKKCMCKFTFEEEDLHQYPTPDGRDFDWCPNCVHQIIIEQLIEYKKPEPKPITVSRKTRYGGRE
jgi:hypothetical protein